MTNNAPFAAGGTADETLLPAADAEAFPLPAAPGPTVRGASPPFTA